MADEDDSVRNPTLPASAAQTLLPDVEDTQPSAVRRQRTLIGGRYELGVKLGAGGMGVVWEADDLSLPRKVAVKILHPAAADSDGAMRLRREAELLAQVDHPHVVSVLDFGFVEPGRPFVVMERVRGVSLSALIAEQGQLGWPQAVALAVQICEGLGSAHALGIIHRDLKASNVLVTHDAHGRSSAKIIDFGLAKATAVTDRARVPTSTGQVFGTPAYMAPEQVRGEPLDPRADVYALGVVLFEMLAGRRPWLEASVVEMLYAQLFQPPPPLRMCAPDVPIELEHIVARCLAKNRDDRPTGVDAVRSALLGVGTRGGTVAPVMLGPPSQPVVFGSGSLELAPSRSAAAWAIGGMVAAAALGGVIWFGMARDKKPLPPLSPPPVVDVQAPQIPVAAPPPVQQPVATPPAQSTVIVLPPLPGPVETDAPDADRTLTDTRRPRAPKPVDAKVPAKPIEKPADPDAPAAGPSTPKLGPSGTFDSPFDEPPVKD